MLKQFPGTLHSLFRIHSRVNPRSVVLLRWLSSGSPMLLIVFINIAETKPFTILNSRYLLTNTGSW